MWPHIIDAEMKIERTVTVAVNEAIALERATAYLRQVGYKQVSREPFLVFQRGFVLGSLTSFTPKHWRSKAKIHIMPDNNRVKVVVVFEVNRIGQFVIGKDKAFWDAEIEGLKAAICSGDIDTTKETKVAREALVQYIAVTIAIVSIILIAFVAAIWISTSASGPAEDVIAAWHLSQGNRFYRQDNYDKAIEAYNKAIEYNPNLARAYNHISLAYGYKGQHDMAISSCNKAIELDPSLSSAYNNRAVAYALKGEYDLAIADYSRAIELEPNKAKLYSNRSANYIDKGQYDMAIADCNKAIELDSNYAIPYRNRGIAYKEQGRKAEAIADFEKFITLTDDAYQIEIAKQKIEELSKW